MTQTTDTPSDHQSLLKRAEDVIARIRPTIQDDGGDVELVQIDENFIAHIRLHGACIGCPSSQMTLQMGIERNLKQLVPEITGVQQVH